MLDKSKLNEDVEERFRKSVDRYYVSPNKQPKFNYNLAYKVGGVFLSDCDKVEEWGCTHSDFKMFCNVPYIGIDDIASTFTEKLVDFGSYTSLVEGIFMRHVIEFRRDWDIVLKNALKSFTHKMVLVLSTPFMDQTHEIELSAATGTVDMAFAKEDIIELIEQTAVQEWNLREGIEIDSTYGVEHIFLLRR